MVHDGVEPTWHSLLDIESYSIRVAQADMPRVPEILRAVPQEEIERMRANLAHVWRRRVCMPLLLPLWPLCCCAVLLPGQPAALPAWACRSVLAACLSTISPTMP